MPGHPQVLHPSSLKEGERTSWPRAKTAVVRLDLQKFRSYGDLALQVDARPVVLAGPNGAGKTNLLEAISMLSPGRGLRSVDLKDMAQANGAGELLSVAPHIWAVSADVMTADGQLRIGTGAELTRQGGFRRVVRIDGESTDGTAVLGQHVRMAWLTPAHDRLFADGKTARRRFLDRLVLGHDPAHAGRVGAYEKAMRDRQRLLKDRSNDAAWLSALEATMAEKGVAIVAARLEMVARLQTALLAQTDSVFPHAHIALVGDLEADVSVGAAVDVEDAMVHELAQGRRRDAEAGRCLFGPHRSDLLVRHAEKDMPAKLCSTGEQKALLIGIFLANARTLCQAESAMSPLLLMDEVAAHLDEARRAALFDELCRLGCQAWMTGTDHALFAAFGERAQSFTVDQGRIWPAA